MQRLPRHIIRTQWTLIYSHCYIFQTWNQSSLCCIFQLVELLLKHGANPLQTNSHGKTPLDVASTPEMVRILKEGTICSTSDSSSIDDARSPMSPDSINSYKDDDKSLDLDGKIGLKTLKKRQKKMCCTVKYL